MDRQKKIFHVNATNCCYRLIKRVSVLRRAAFSIRAVFGSVRFSLGSLLRCAPFGKNRVCTLGESRNNLIWCTIPPKDPCRNVQSQKISVPKCPLCQKIPVAKCRLYWNIQVQKRPFAETSMMPKCPCVKTSPVLKYPCAEISSKVSKGGQTF